MEKLTDLIREFAVAQADLGQSLKKFPEKKRALILFGEWNLKDVVAHFTGWDKEFVETLTDFSRDKPHQYWGKIYEFNARVVSESQNKSWTRVMAEWSRWGEVFTNCYQKIPADKLDVKIWKDKIYTPLRILEINIHHYQKAQLVRIKELLA